MNKITSGSIFLVLFLFANLSFAQVWTQKKAMGDSLKRVSMPGFSIGDTGYIVTGVDTFSYQSSTHTYNDMWAYDPVNDNWLQRASFPGGGRSAACGAAIGTKAYVGLGWNGSSYLKDFYEYDQSTDAWTQMASFPGQGTRNTFCAAFNNYVFVGGGNGSNQFWVYDSFLNSWTRLSNMPFGGRSGGVSFATDSFIYIGLGQNNGSDFNDFWKYNPSSQSWTQLPNFPGVGRLQASAVKVGNNYFVGGGHRLNSGFRLNDFYEFNPVTDTWSSLATNSPVSRSMSGSFSINGKGYLVGGVSVTDSIMSNTYEISYQTTHLKGVTNENNVNLNIYPIPITDNQLSIQIDKSALIKVYDINGKELYFSRLLAGLNVVEMPYNKGVILYRIIGESFNKTGVIPIIH